MSNTVQMDFRFQPDCRCNTVHVIGSWDGYAKQLPLAKDGKSGYWKGAFRFPDKTLENGGRYWYYYLLDGYKTAHNHEKPFVRESTTGRILNILDMPSKRLPTSSRTLPVQGRPLSPERIAAPRPSRPQQAYSHLTKPSQARDMAVQELSRRLLHERIDSSDESVFESDSDVSDRRSDPSSHTSSSSDDSDSDLDLRGSDDSPPSLIREISPPTSVSSSDDGSYIDMSHGYPVKVSPVGFCTCQRWGITRSGQRIKLECAGDLCGFSYKEVQCSAALRSGSVSSSDDDKDKDYRFKPKIQARAPTKSSSSKSSSSKHNESSSSNKYKESSSSSKYKESSSSGKSSKHEVRSSRRR